MFGGRSVGISLPVTMSRPLYICRESAERRLTDPGGVRFTPSGTSGPRRFAPRNDWFEIICFAMERAREVLPEVVGPQMTKTLFIRIVILYYGWSEIATARVRPPARADALASAGRRFVMTGELWDDGSGSEIVFVGNLIQNFPAFFLDFSRNIIRVESCGGGFRPWRGAG